MKVSVVRGQNLENFILEKLQQVKDSDLLILSAGVVDGVDFSEEFEADSSTLYELSLLSSTMGGVVVAIVKTYLYGVKRLSIVVCDNGKVLGVSDQTMCGNSEYTAGFGYPIYETSCGRFGAIIGEDIAHFLPIHTLYYGGADFFIAATMDKICDNYIKFVEANSLLSSTCAVATCADCTFSVSDGSCDNTDSSDIFSFECGRISRYKGYQIKEKSI